MSRRPAGGPKPPPSMIQMPGGRNLDPLAAAGQPLQMVPVPVHKPWDRIGPMEPAKEGGEPGVFLFEFDGGDPIYCPCYDVHVSGLIRFVLDDKTTAPFTKTEITLAATGLSLPVSQRYATWGFAGGVYHVSVVPRASWMDLSPSDEGALNQFFLEAKGAGLSLESQKDLDLLIQDFRTREKPCNERSEGSEGQEPPNTSKSAETGSLASSEDSGESTETS